jgi:hypothetical protein
VHRALAAEASVEKKVKKEQERVRRRRRVRAAADAVGPGEETGLRTDAARGPDRDFLAVSGVYVILSVSRIAASPRV